MGLNVTTGHIRGARGQYMRRDQEAIGTGGVRTKMVNDLPTTMHEFGHAIDDKYNLTGSLQAGYRMNEQDRLTKSGAALVRERVGIGQEVIRNMDPEFAKQYPENRQLSEGVAEFFRKFTQNRLQAQADYPLFYAYVMKTIPVEEQAVLLSMADDVNAYYSLDKETAQSAIHSMNERRPDGLTFKERAGKTFDKYSQLVYDHLRPVRMLAKDLPKVKLMSGEEGPTVDALFYNALAAASMSEEQLQGDLRDMDGNYIGPGLKAAWSKIKLNDPEQYKEFGEYMVSRRAPYIIDREMTVMADDRKNTAEFFHGRQKALEAKYPDTFKSSFEKYKQWKHDFNVEYYVNSGLMSRKMLDVLEEIDPDYSPFYRVLDDAEKGGGPASKSARLFANQPAVTKAMHGSGREIINPIDGVIAQVPRIVQQAVKNRAALALIDAAREYGVLANIMEQIPVPLSKRDVDVSGVHAELSEKIKHSDLSDDAKEQVLEIIQNQGDILKMFEARDTPPKGCVSVRRNGELERYKINDPQLLAALTETGKPELRGPLLKGIAWITRNSAALQTGLKVTWAAFSNPVRDFVSALVYLDGKDRAKFVPALFDAYKQEILHKRESANADPLYRQSECQHLTFGHDKKPLVERLIFS